MRYCKKCTMPDTRPGIVFDENGVCSACNNYAKRKEIDWDKRFKEFEEFCDKYRNCNGKGQYDCAVAVSGGKDSHFQVHMLKEVMNMHPILFTVEDNFTMTEAGKHNLRNLSEEFGCTLISCKPNIKAQKALTRMFFEKYGSPTWYIDRLIYTFPLYMSIKFHTPMLCYGENVSFEYGGVDAEETYSARKQIENGVAVSYSDEELHIEGVTEEDLSLIKAPPQKDLDMLDPFYLSYYVPWNSYANYIFAKKRGFHDLIGEWDRTHCAENFDQVDSMAYLVHAWLKYPKYGHTSATDYTARFVRYGMMSREEAIDIVRRKDSALDSRCVRDFCSFCGYRESEFYEIIDKLYNRDIFEKNEFGEWALKKPIWDERTNKRDVNSVEK
ncbi:N-acetyl sugar amidotransferase [Selenomonas sp. AB3002]|uniref:N-acetyl sugar amidotransferase n=1 Tax=Selenomonas sp. AB3002 TaxID=1392502 RepID=UPI0004985419